MARMMMEEIPLDHHHTWMMDGIGIRYIYIYIYIYIF